MHDRRLDLCLGMIYREFNAQNIKVMLSTIVHAVVLHTVYVIVLI